MLENYTKLDNGLIKQDSINKIEYNSEYITTSYNNYGLKTTQMAYLRLGYMLGVLKTIPTSILDVGYGNGEFIKTCTNIVKHCYGNDISGYPIPKGVEFVEDIFSTKFDIVCFFDVLEHFENIYEIKNLQTEYIIISLPECHYFSDEWFQTWKHRRLDEHLWHFNKSSLITFMKEIGYESMDLCNIEDTIRKHPYEYSNILTGVFKKI
jgi:SAM-dependent methyltransferase